LKPFGTVATIWNMPSVRSMRSTNRERITTTLSSRTICFRLRSSRGCGIDRSSNQIGYSRQPLLRRASLSLMTPLVRRDERTPQQTAAPVWQHHGRSETIRPHSRRPHNNARRPLYPNHKNGARPALAQAGMLWALCAACGKICGSQRRIEEMLGSRPAATSICGGTDAQSGVIKLSISGSRPRHRSQT
jgi:hypothetical protein